MTRRFPVSSVRMRFATPSRGATLVAFGILFVIVLAAVPASAPPPPPRWIQKASMPTARGFFGIAELGGKVYVAGGLVVTGGNSAVTAAVEIYDPGSDTWSTAPSLPTPRWGLALVAVSGRLVAAGGSTSGSAPMGVTTVTEVYDPTTNRWTTAAPLPAPRIWAAAVALGSEAQVWGGSADGSSTAAGTRWSYDMAANQWTEVSPMPLPRSNFGVAVVGDTVYLTGGWRNLANTTAYRATSRAWEELAPMVKGRGGHASVDLDGQVYVIGGVTADTTECAPSASVEIYDPASNAWFSPIDFPEGVTALGAVRVGSTVFALGGARCDASSSSVYQLEVFVGYRPPGPGLEWLIASAAIAVILSVSVVFVFRRSRRRVRPTKPRAKGEG